MEPASTPSPIARPAPQSPVDRVASIAQLQSQPLFTEAGVPVHELNALFGFLSTSTTLNLIGADAKAVVGATQQAWFKEFENEFPTETRLRFEKEGNPSDEFLGLMRELGHLEQINVTPGREVSAAVVLGGSLAAHLVRLNWLEQNLDNLRTDTVILNGADRKILASETEQAFSTALGRTVTYKDLPFVVEKAAHEVPVGQIAATTDKVLQVNESLMMKYLIENSDRFPKIAAKEIVASHLTAEQLKIIGRPKAGTLEALIPLAVTLGDRFHGPINLEVVSSQPHVTRQGIDVAWGIVNTRPDVELKSAEAIGAPLVVGEKNIFGVKSFLQELAKRIRVEALSKGLITAD